MQKNAPQKNAPAPMTAAPPSRFTFRADKLIGELGISRAQLHLRMEAHLRRGVHWEVVNKHRALSPEGAALLRSAPETPPAAPAEPRPVRGLLTAPLQPGEFNGELIAWKAPLKNARLLIAYLKGTDPNNPMNLVNVRVKSNLNFIRGMTVRNARHVENITYEATGAMPRWRGKY